MGQTWLTNIPKMAVTSPKWPTVPQLNRNSPSCRASDQSVHTGSFHQSKRGASPSPQGKRIKSMFHYPPTRDLVQTFGTVDSTPSVRRSNLSDNLVRVRDTGVGVLVHYLVFSQVGLEIWVELTLSGMGTSIYSFQCVCACV